MKVESTGKRARSGVFFLNSEVKHQDPKNFTIFISKTGAEKFKTAKVDDPATHFKGKLVRVTGTVKLYRERPEIAVEEPEQVEIVEQKKP
jgi:DNA/RNA endonuclease YhcR with UshA esterase domain